MKLEGRRESTNVEDRRKQWLLLVVSASVVLLSI